VPTSALGPVLQPEPVTPAGLAQRRRALGLTQRALAELLGVSRNTFARWERGDLRVGRPEWLGMALWQLEHAHEDDVPSGTPSPPTHLPAEFSSFVGRDREVAECRALLARERLVTFTGTGGIGKSRLALRVASSVAASFPDGMYMVELETLRESSLVPRAVANALGVARRAAADANLTELLVDSLRRKRLLLLLDDCDGVVEGCAALVHELLRSAPHLRVLATSREPLSITGEIKWHVPALGTPSEEGSFDEIAASEAVQLFVERARAVAPWFKLTEANAGQVARVCRRLDGIPLAIELAAAHMKALRIDQLRKRLEDTFALLDCGNRSAPSRQQTLRATVQWSTSLLSEHQRVMLRRLSVFCGGWPLEAAERVTAGDPLEPGETLCLLERLIDKSLVVSEEREGTVRMRMLDTLREYACECLVEHGGEAQVLRRHFDWMLELIESIDPETIEPEVIPVLALELHNLRCALTWAIESAETKLALRLATAAGVVFNFSGHFAEGISWLERALALPGACAVPVLQGKALKVIGNLSYGLGDMARARDAITRGYALIAGRASTRDAPLFGHLLGNIARASGDLDSALSLYEAARREYQQMGRRFWEATTLFLIGSVRFEQGDHPGARAACEQCLALSRERAYTWASSRARIILAYLAQAEDNYPAAEQLAHDGLAQQRAVNEPSGIGISLRALSQFALEQRQLGRAWSFLAEALEIARWEGDRMALARTLETIACVLASQAPARAAEIYGAASVLRKRTGTTPWPIEQVRITRWLDVARRLIGDKSMETARAAGELLSEAGAIAAARQYVPEALSTPPLRPERSSPADGLTDRQREVAALVARGLTNEQIAQQLVISPATARAHVEHVLDRLDLHRRAELAAWVVTQGLLTSTAASER
jgi:predicted ATPase/DNA-binding CsgD family transcriptional regulator